MKKTKVMCIAAHPDDEVLGCGATMAWHAERGDAVEVVIMAEGLTARQETRQKTNSTDFTDLHAACHKANQLLGVKKVHLLGLPDNRMDSCDLLDVVKKLEEKINDFQPTRIYTHFSGDLNIDHEITYRAVLTACRPQPGHSVREILSFEVPSATGWYPTALAAQFTPNTFINVEQTIEKKLQALEVYRSEMREFPHARSLEALKALAAYRGTTVGCAAAEAFQLVRMCVD